MADDGHHAAVVVEKPPIVNFARVRTAFPRDDLSSCTGSSNPDGRNLRSFLQVVNTVKNRVLQRQIPRFLIRKYAFDFTVEVVPLVAAPEVVHHQEPAIEQIAAERDDFLFPKQQLPRFDHVNKRIVEKFQIREPQDVAVRVDMQRCELLQTIREIQLRIRVVDGPAIPATPGAVLNANEGKDVVFEFFVHLPLRDASTVGPVTVSVPRAAVSLTNGNSSSQDDHSEYDSQERPLHDDSGNGNNSGDLSLSQIGSAFASPELRTRP